jgi:hypothetical protein
MKTPVAVTLSGDLVRANLLRGRAMKEMYVLEEFMKFQDLQQCVRRVKVGSYSKVSLEAGGIEASVKFGIRRVHIHVPPKGDDGGEGDVAWYWYALHKAFHAATFTVTEGLADITLSPSKNVYVVGMSRTRHEVDGVPVSPSFSVDPVVMWYSNDGDFRNRRVIVGGVAGGGAAPPDFGVGVAIDTTSDPDDNNRGGVYVNAQVYQNRHGNNYDASLIKYDYIGNIKWHRRLTWSTENNLITPWGVESDADGNAVLNGHYTVFKLDPWGTYVAEAVYGYLVSLRYNGSVNWKKRIGGKPEGLGGPDFCEIFGTAIDAQKNIVAVGGRCLRYHNNESMIHPDGLIAKFSQAGALIWARSLYCVIWHVNLHGDTGVYVGGTKISSCNTDKDGAVYFVSHGQSPSSVPIWESSVGQHHVNIIKLSPNGEQLWQRVLELPWFNLAGGQNFRASIAVGSNGVYVTATKSPDTTASPHILWGTYILKFQKDTGDVIWQRLVMDHHLHPDSRGESQGNGLDTASGGVYAHQIRADAGGDIYIAAQLYQNVQMLTIKLPGHGNFLGKKGDLMFSDPDLPVFTSMEQVPVRYLTSANGQPPWHDMYIRSDFTLPVQDESMLVSSPETGDYGVRSQGKTTFIMKKQRDKNA